MNNTNNLEVVNIQLKPNNGETYTVKKSCKKIEGIPLKYTLPLKYTDNIDQSLRGIIQTVIKNNKPEILDVKSTNTKPKIKQGCVIPKTVYNEFCTKINERINNIDYTDRLQEITTGLKQGSVKDKQTLKVIGTVTNDTVKYTLTQQLNYFINTLPIETMENEKITVNTQERTPNVIFQPYRQGINNYIKSVKNGVPISIIRKHINDPKCIKKLEDKYKDGLVHLWGVREGRNNEGYWTRIKNDDIVLFYKDEHFNTIAKVSYKYKSKELANELWDPWVSPEGDLKSYSYIYFVYEIEELEHPISRYDLNSYVGPDYNNTYQNFALVKDDKLDKILKYLNENLYIITVEEFRHVTSSFTGEYKGATTGEQLKKVRKEQKFLRDYLFKEIETNACGICNERLPKDFLWTAHIKKRSACTEEERMKPYIVMPMCKFGCDDLYENGYIYVENNKVKVHKWDQNDRSKETKINNYLKKIEDSEVDEKWYNEKTKQFFKDHYNNIK